MNHINHVLKSYTILPIDICNIILEYSNTTIEKIHHNCYTYNNYTYRIDDNCNIYYFDKCIAEDIDSFAITVINGTDCIITESDDTITVKNLATNCILSSYTIYDYHNGIEYYDNRVYFSIDTCESDNDATYLLHVLEIDTEFNIIRKYSDDDILGMIEYVDGEIIIVQYKYVHCTNELRIYTINLIDICTIDIRHLPYLTDIVKNNNILHYVTCNHTYRIDIENKRVV